MGQADYKYENGEYGLPAGEEEKAISRWEGILKTVLRVPGVHVDRATYLARELAVRGVPEAQIQEAIEKNPARAGIPKEIMDKIAEAAINRHTWFATCTSIVAGIPGGIALFGTIPLDVGQYYYHVFRVIQKLAYAYGWPELYDPNEQIDDETILQITLFFAGMSGSRGAAKAIGTLAQGLAREAGKRIPRTALTKYGVYVAAKQVLRWFGINLTKASLGRTLSKVIPVVGGLLCGGLTYTTFKPMAKNLANYLRDLPLASRT